jgi:tRNA(Ile)-lysidine synthase
MYHVPVHTLAQRVLAHVRRGELLQAGDRVGVAVSGGIDSVALLRLLLELRQELGIVLSVVHFNHKLRGAESDADQEFASQLAREHDLEFFCESGDTAQLANEEHKGLEAAARELRYKFFWRLMGPQEENSPLLPKEGRNGTPAKANWDGTPDRSARSAALPKIAPNKIATAHTLDDQAETVLMRLIRGTGPRGLGGIHPRVILDDADDEHDDQADENDNRGEIVRPLLGIRRREIEQYLTDLKQPWREDATNSDSTFTRNRVRKLLLPLVEREFNPSIVENLSELADISRDEEDYWENEIAGWMGTVVQWSQPEWTRGLSGFSDSQPLVQIQTRDHNAEPDSRNSKENSAELAQRIEHSSHAIANCTVSRPWLVTEPKAAQRRVIKAIGEQAGIPLEFKHVETILHFAAEDGHAAKELSLPLGWKVIRQPEAIVFVTPDLRHAAPASDYEYPLTLPGRVTVPELGVVVEALCISSGPGEPEYNPQQLLDAQLLRESFTVRNWRPGDRFWPAHTKSPKKIKELLQGKHVPQPERRLWPVVLNKDEIIWVRGFVVPEKFRWKRCLAETEGNAVLIREVPFREE